MITNRATVICPTCGGRGYTTTPRTRECHGSNVICETCGGDRVVQEVTTVQYRRAEYDNSILNALLLKSG